MGFRGHRRSLGRYLKLSYFHLKQSEKTGLPISFFFFFLGGWGGVSLLICQTSIAELSYKENIWRDTGRSKRGRDRISWEEWERCGMQKENNAMLSAPFIGTLLVFSSLTLHSRVTHLWKHRLGSQENIFAMNTLVGRADQERTKESRRERNASNCFYARAPKCWQTCQCCKPEKHLKFPGKKFLSCLVLYNLLSNLHATLTKSWKGKNMNAWIKLHSNYQQKTHWCITFRNTYTLMNTQCTPKLN